MSQITITTITTTPEELRAIIREEVAQTKNNSMPPLAAELEILKRKEYLTVDEVSKLYSLSVATLNTKRSRGGGPSYVKDGDRVLYSPKAVQQYLDARRVKVSD